MAGVNGLPSNVVVDLLFFIRVTYHGNIPVSTESCIDLLHSEITWRLLQSCAVYSNKGSCRPGKPLASAGAGSTNAGIADTSKRAD